MPTIADWLDTPPESVAAWATWLAAIAAGLVAIGWLGREAVKVARFVLSLARRADALLDLADHELTPNSGGSIKDAADKIPAIERRLNDHITASEEDRSDLRLDLGALTSEMASLVKGQGQQDDVIANLSKALPIVAASHPPTEHEEG
jgi:hypothetical protein